MPSPSHLAGPVHLVACAGCYMIMRVENDKILRVEYASARACYKNGLGVVGVGDRFDRIIENAGFFIKAVDQAIKSGVGETIFITRDGKRVVEAKLLPFMLNGQLYVMVMNRMAGQLPNFTPEPKNLSDNLEVY